MSRLCRAAVRATGCDGAALTVMTADGVRALSAASGEQAAQIEDLQFTLGEGPCVDAYTLRRPVLVADLHGKRESRWPGYLPAIDAYAVAAVFAFPLQTGAGRLGVMNLYRATAGMLTAAQLAYALTFADAAVAALISGHDAPSPGWLDDPLGPRARLFQAQGMVMVQLGSDLADAMARMRAHAFAHGVPLAAVAAAVIARELIFDKQDP